ncbi:MAG: extensin family protein [Sandaracinaceae bacterium]|nr:extensin family protein [Sandaracinaceae bacterium]
MHPQGFAIVFAILFCSLSARAQSEDPLRERVVRLRANRPPGVSEGALISIDYLLDVSARIARGFPEQSSWWRRQAESFIQLAEAGRDPYPEQRGRIVNRGYESPISLIRQGYAVYIPPDYDPKRRYPMMVVLHGGSSNGNLFLGVVLGNNMKWETYSQHLWDAYTPRWYPDWIVVAPDGFGHVLWRWMGEADVLAVIEDVQRHYSVDPDRIVLCGLSNGGLGAYAIGMRNAWRFSIVMAIAGAPSWLQYAGGRPTLEERLAMLPWSGMHLIENSVNTDFRFYHGTRDPGPMRPAFVRELEAHMRSLGLEPKVRWYNFGHDLLYIVHRHGQIYPELAQIRRNRRPEEVRLITGDYRANRQHWVSVTRLERYPELAKVVARASDGLITATTSNVLELRFELSDAPTGSGPELRIEIDGQQVYRGQRSSAPSAFHRKEGNRWAAGPLPSTGMLEKMPGLSGPLTDPYYERMVHVYGTQNPAHTEALRREAERGARGWPIWLWGFRQEVRADTEVDENLMRSAHLVLYGTPGSNLWIERWRDRLPIRIDAKGIVVGERRFEGTELGVRFVYPNPQTQNRYIIVQAGTTPTMVGRGHELPDFLPDWVVYELRSTARRPRLISGQGRQVAMGYFDRFWRVPSGGSARMEIKGDPLGIEWFQAGPSLVDDTIPASPIIGSTTAQNPKHHPLHHRVSSSITHDDNTSPLFAITLRQHPPIQLPVTPPPPPPPLQEHFLAPPSDQAGRAARMIAAQAQGFPNHRGIVPGATWATDPLGLWSIRPQGECLEALRSAPLAFKVLSPELFPTPVPAPVELAGSVADVEFRSLHSPLRMACELALRLPEWAVALRKLGIRRVDVLSSYRPHPWTSFHRFGLALDIVAFESEDGTRFSVEHDFIETPAHHTCDAPLPPDPKASLLLRIACDLFERRLVSTVLTPNYNEGHRNHFHLDIRPDDPRFYIR